MAGIEAEQAISDQTGGCRMKAYIPIPYTTVVFVFSWDTYGEGSMYGKLHGVNTCICLMYIPDADDSSTLITPLFNLIILPLAIYYVLLKSKPYALTNRPPTPNPLPDLPSVRYPNAEHTSHHETNIPPPSRPLSLIAIPISPDFPCSLSLGGYNSKTGSESPFNYLPSSAPAAHCLTTRSPSLVSSPSSSTTSASSSPAPCTSRAACSRDARRDSSSARWALISAQSFSFVDCVSSRAFSRRECWSLK